MHYKVVFLSFTVIQNTEDRFALQLSGEFTWKNGQMGLFCSNNCVFIWVYSSCIVTGLWFLYSIKIMNISVFSFFYEG